jgi:hypothetical protein
VSNDDLPLLSYKQRVNLDAFRDYCLNMGELNVVLITGNVFVSRYFRYVFEKTGLRIMVTRNATDILLFRQEPLSIGV